MSELSPADHLATALHSADCGCPDWSPGDDEDERYDKGAADALAAIVQAGFVVLPPGGVTTPIWGLRHDYEQGVGAPASFYETCGSGQHAEAMARNAAADGDGVLIRREKVDWPDGSKLTTAWSPVDPPVAAVVEPITQEVG